MVDARIGIYVIDFPDIAQTSMAPQSGSINPDHSQRQCM